MNKLGGEKLLSIWWFFVLALVGAAIVVGVIIFYSAEVDVRGVEADILGEKILYCLNNQGYLDQNILKKEFDIFKECGLKKELFDEGSRFYFEVVVSGEDGKITEVYGGSRAFKADCEVAMTHGVEARYYPRCVRKTENILYFQGEMKKGKIVLLAGSNQEGKKTD